MPVLNFDYNKIWRSKDIATPRPLQRRFVLFCHICIDSSGFISLVYFKFMNGRNEYGARATIAYVVVIISYTLTWMEQVFIMDRECYEKGLEKTLCGKMHLLWNTCADTGKCEASFRFYNEIYFNDEVKQLHNRNINKNHLNVSYKRYIGT